MIMVSLTSIPPSPPAPTAQLLSHPDPPPLCFLLENKQAYKACFNNKTRYNKIR